MDNVQNQPEAWKKIEATMDSGAGENVTSKKTIPGMIVTTDGPKFGAEYSAAEGSISTKIGEGKVTGVSDEGIPVNLTAQIGDKMKEDKLLMAFKNAVNQ